MRREFNAFVRNRVSELKKGMKRQAKEEHVDEKDAKKERKVAMHDLEKELSVRFEVEAANIQRCEMDILHLRQSIAEERLAFEHLQQVRIWI